MNTYRELIERQRAYFLTGATRDVPFRLEMLKRLLDAVTRYEADLFLALKADLNKSTFESYVLEIGVVREEIRFAIKHLKRWAKPRKVKTTLPLFGSASWIYPEPYGVCLIVAPWNYPFNLAVAPLIGAIAAGNCAVLKPSELSPHTSQVLARLIRETFPEEYVCVVEGGVEESNALLRERFDHIFFTGSVHVGKIVMEAASRHLTPVTLELGGKSPCIVHADANLDLAARRIAWGKCLNAGQTCVAPDYLLVHRQVKEALLERMRSAIAGMYGEDVMRNPDYTRIVSQRHFERLTRFLRDGEAVIGGRHDPVRLVIEPTVLDCVQWDDPVMQEEIFGPILPVLAYDNLDEAIAAVNARPKPLALYLFTESAKVQQTVLAQVSFGGGCVNDTLYHLANPHLPFGGVGESGIGGYHGKHSFDTFSHHKSVLKQTTLFDIPLRYPQTKHALKMIRMFLR